MLLLHPTLTCIDAGPDFAPWTLSFAPMAFVGCHWEQLTVMVFLPQQLAKILHLHMRWFHPLQLAPVVIYITKHMHVVISNTFQYILKS